MEFSENPPDPVHALMNLIQGLEVVRERGQITILLAGDTGGTALDLPLLDAGFRVVKSGSEQAGECAGSQYADLVVIRCGEPAEAAGICRAIRNANQGPAIPIVVVTSAGTGFPISVEDADAHLKEPLDTNALIACVCALLRSRAAESERDRLALELRAEKRRLGSLAAATHAMVWTTGPGGQFESANSQWEAFTGQQWPEYADFGGFQVIHPEDRELVSGAWQKAIENQEPFQAVYRLWHEPTSRYRFVSARGAPALASGVISEWVGVIEDIDEQKRTAFDNERANALLASFTGSAPIGFAFFDNELRYRMINASLAEMNGFPVEAHIGRSVEEIVPDLAQQVKEAYRRIVEDGKPLLDMEFSGETAQKPGERRHWAESWYPVRTQDGRLLGVGAVIVEVTDRRRAEQALKEHRERLAAALDASRTGTFHWDIRTNAVTWDENLDRLYGLEPGATIRSLEQFVSLVHPDDRDTVVAALEHSALEGMDFICEVRVNLPDRSIRWLLNKGKAYFDAQGSPAYMTGACVDITERKLAEQKLVAANQRFLLAAKAVRGLVYDWDLATGKVFRSEGLAELIGIRPEDAGAEADWWLDRIHPDDRSGTERRPELMASEGVIEQEYRIRHRDGHLVHVWDRAIVVRDEAGEAVRLVGSVSDVTAWKQAQEALRQSQQRLKTMAETVPEILFTNRPDGTWDYVSGRFYEYTGMPEGMAAGYGWTEALHPEDAERCLSHWDRCLQEGNAYEDEYRLRARSGEYRWFTARAVPLRDHGAITEWAGVAVDVDDLKRIQKLLERKTADLERSNQELQRFAYVISHDLQSPLRTVATMTQLFGRRYKGSLDAKADELIGLVYGGVSRMSRLITDLLEYSRLSEHDESPREPVDTLELVKWALMNLEAQIKESEASISVEEPLPYVRADQQLGRVFQNLIGNAIKYRGDRRPQVRITSLCRGDRATFTVSDNGIGFDMQHAEQIFGVFQRLHTGHEFEGTGIGLAICKRIIERYGGNIWVESEPGVGSSFYFTLPYVADGVVTP